MGRDDQNITAVRGVVSGCFKEVRLARATELAHSRRYLEAIALLAPQGDLPSSARELDLLARIAARQRRYADAELYWRKAAEITPDPSDYREAAICAAGAGRNLTQRKQVVLASLVAVLLALVVLAIINLIMGSIPSASAANKPIPPNQSVGKP